MYDYPDLEPGYRSLLDVLRVIWSDSCDHFPPTERNPEERALDAESLKAAGRGEQFPESFVEAVIRAILTLELRVEGVRATDGEIFVVPKGRWNSRSGPWMVTTARYPAPTFEAEPDRGPLVNSKTWLNLRVSEEEAERLSSHFHREIVEKRGHERFEAELPGLLPADPGARNKLEVYLRVLDRFMELHDSGSWTVDEVRAYLRPRLGSGFSPRLFNEARTGLTGRGGKFHESWGKSGPKRKR